MTHHDKQVRHLKATDELADHGRLGGLSGIYALNGAYYRSMMLEDGEIIVKESDEYVAIKTPYEKGDLLETETYYFIVLGEQNGHTYVMCLPKKTGRNGAGLHGIGYDALSYFAKGGYGGTPKPVKASHQNKTIGIPYYTEILGEPRGG